MVQDESKRGPEGPHVREMQVQGVAGGGLLGGGGRR